jgi:hypothetical protein
MARLCKARRLEPLIFLSTNAGWLSVRILQQTL